MLNDEIEARRQKEHFYEKDYFLADPEMMEDYLNEFRAFSLHQTWDLGFPYWEYPKLQETGYCIGELKFKEWGVKMSLVTYFDLQVGFLGRGKFTTYRDRKEKYQPSKGHVDLSEAYIGDLFLLKLNHKAGGNSYIEEIWEYHDIEDAKKVLNELMKDWENEDKEDKST